MELEFETETVAEVEAEAVAEAEIVQELEFESAFELESRQELEIEPFGLEQLPEEGADPFDLDRAGVRAIETTIRAIEER